MADDGKNSGQKDGGKQTNGKLDSSKQDRKSALAGHRQRLRARFMEGGPSAVADYELLELILFLAIPRGDTKPIAKALIDRFGSFAEAVSAPRAAILEIKGMGDAGVVALKTIAAGAERLAQEQAHEQPVLSSFQSVIDYCRIAMARHPVEQFRVLFLDKQNRLIRDEVQGEGTIDQTPAYPREVIRRALELGATAVILAHNHPSGDPMPSKADVTLTKAIAKAGEAIGVTVLDHIIVGRKGHESLKAGRYF